MNYNLKRPKRIGQEDEDDLIRFQEKFLKNKKERPAATVVKKQAKIETQNEQHTKENVKEKKARVEIDFESENIILGTVLKDIVEKPLISKWSEENIMLARQNGHDQTLKVDKIDFKSLNNEKKKTKSLFAQNLEKQGKLRTYFELSKIQDIKVKEKDEKIKQVEAHVAPKLDENFKRELNGTSIKKQIISGDGLGNLKDVEQIHMENLEIISKMKPEEILNEQHKLVQQLDPKILAFIRGKTRNTQTSDLNVGIKGELGNDMNEFDKEEILNELPIKPNKKWLHMDKIEYDKLEWMIKPRNVVKNETNDSSSARFDFDGNLISPKEEIPITKALHHHGNDPDSAGYTLDELFHLARSKFNQQRVIALQTLGNILSKCHQGHYDQIIKAGKRVKENGEPLEDDLEEAEMENDKNNLLHQLIEGGILFLLRWNLDDQTESIINACLIGIKNLLQPPEQESNLDYTFDWYKGYEIVCLHPFSSIFNESNKLSGYMVDKNLNVNERKELGELKDDEYILQDLIRGLFRMNLIDRMHYLLDKYKPALATNIIEHNIFQILFRCMRHSGELCYEFSEKHSKLLDLIIKNYLPLYIPIDKSNTNIILTNAANCLKLIRLISSAGPSIAFKIYNKYNISQYLVNYLTIENYITNSNLETEKLNLQIETTRLLKVLCLYCDEKMGISCVLDSYEIVLNKMIKIVNLYNPAVADVNKIEQIALHLQAIIALFDGIMLTLNEQDKNLNQKYQICSTAFSIMQPFTVKLFKIVIKYSVDSVDNGINLNLLSVCINFMVNYLEKCDYFSAENKVEILSKKMKSIEDLVENIVIPLTNETRTENFNLDQLLMSKILKNSTSSNEESIHNCFKKIYSNNLSYLPTIMDPALDESKRKFIKNSPFVFLTAFLRLYLICFRLRMKMIDNKSFSLTHKFLNNSYLKSYLKIFVKNNSQEKHSTNNSYLIMKYESLFVYYCVKLAFSLFNLEDDDYKKLDDYVKKKNLDEDDPMEAPKQDPLVASRKKFDEKRLYYLVGLSLMTKFKCGDEYFINDIITSCLFNMNFWSLYLPSNQDLNNLGNRDLILSSASATNFLTSYFEQMSIKDEKNDSSSSSHIEFSYLNINNSKSETIKINKSFINSLESFQIYESLNQIKFVYLDNNYLFSNRLLEHSNLLNNVFKVSNLKDFNKKKINSLFISSLNSNKFLLKSDWFYMPIVAQLKQLEIRAKLQTNIQEQTKLNDMPSHKIISTVTNCLKYVYLIEFYLDEYVSNNVDITLRYVRLLYVYLFESEIFLDKQIVTFLYLIFFKYAKHKSNLLETLNFSMKLDGIISFYDFYQYILGHYDSTSFGNYLFSLYLIVPLQQVYSARYRQLFYSDFSHLFKFIKFDTIYTKLLIPMKNFLMPNEKSLNVIRLYSQLVLDQSDFRLFSESKLAYTVIVSHLNSYIFEHVNPVEHKVEFDFKKLLVKQFLSLQNQNLKHDLINFKSYNESKECMEYYDELPNLRKQWLNQLTS